MIRWRFVDPLWLLDVYDSSGKPDAQKILPYIVVLGTLVLHAKGHPLDTATVIVLGAIAFGPRMFGLFLRGRFPATGTEPKP